MIGSQQRNFSNYFVGLRVEETTLLSLRLFGSRTEKPCLGHVLAFVKEELRSAIAWSQLGRTVDRTVLI